MYRMLVVSAMLAGLTLPLNAQGVVMWIPNHEDANNHCSRLVAACVETCGPIDKISDDECLDRCLRVDLCVRRFSRSNLPDDNLPASSLPDSRLPADRLPDSRLPQPKQNSSRMSSFEAAVHPGDDRRGALVGYHALIITSQGEAAGIDAQDVDKVPQFDAWQYVDYGYGWAAKSCRWRAARRTRPCRGP